MSVEKYKIQVDALAVGLTRPPMFMGIDLRLFFFNVIFWTMVCLFTNAVWPVCIGLLVYLWMRQRSIKDPLFLVLRIQAIHKTPPITNKQFWGGINSYEPW